MKTRITKKRSLNDFPPVYSDNEKVLIIEKLSKIEDIEEKINLDIETYYTLFLDKNFKGDIYISDGSKIENSNIHFGEDEIGCYIRDDYDIVRKYYFKDYKKTWAIDKDYFGIIRKD